MHVTVIPGVGPATAERLRRAGIHTVADLESVSEDELVRLLGNAHGHGLYRLARAEDDRPVVPERETKSVSVEGTYDTDLTDRRLMEGLLTRQADSGRRAAARARAVRAHGHPQGAAARLHHPQPVDHAALPHRQRRRPSPGSPAACSPTSTPPAASGCSASASPGLADWIQEDLFGDEPEPTSPRRCPRTLPDGPAPAPGRRADVVHADARAGLGLGLGHGRRHGPLRDRRDARRPGPLVRGRRPRPEPPSSPTGAEADRRPPAAAARSGAGRRAATTPITG